jgi:hypothetical protein
LSYFDNETNVCIWRSSELMSIINVSRNLDDELYLKTISSGCNGKQELCIYSHRSQQEKDAKKYGQENPNNYAQCRLHFYNFSQLQNITLGFEKMWQISNKHKNNPDKSKFLAQIDQTAWYPNLENMIKHSFNVFKYVKVRFDSDCSRNISRTYCCTTTLETWDPV